MDIKGTTRVCGLIGNPVGHSVSPAIHNNLAQLTGKDMVYTTLRSHHEEVKNNNMFLKLLINADTNARELELRGILRNQQVKKD